MREAVGVVGVVVMCGWVGHGCCGQAAVKEGLRAMQGMGGAMRGWRHPLPAGGECEGASLLGRVWSGVGEAA